MKSCVLTPWYTKVNASALSDETRRLIPERVKRKLGFETTLRALDIARGSLYTYLPYTGSGLYRTAWSTRPSNTWGQEFNEIVQGVDRLRAIGIIHGDGNIDYSLRLQAIALATRDEYLKQALLKFTAENFREDLRKMPGTSIPHIVFKWETSFEELFRGRRKGHKIASERIMSYYRSRSLFKRYLKGKRLSEDGWRRLQPEGCG